MGRNAYQIPKPNAFTLIELLIVIVLIGILTTIVIAIIDPDAKQSMAHDGVNVAVINKVVLTTEGFVSSYNRVPNEMEFMDAMEVHVRELFGSECSYVIIPDNECLFFVEGSVLPQTCDLSFWTGDAADTQQCSFRYKGEIQADPKRFRIYAKSMGLVDKVFVYDNMEGGKIYKCPYDIPDFSSLIANCE